MRKIIALSLALLFLAAWGCSSGGGSGASSSANASIDPDILKNVWCLYSYDGDTSYDGCVTLVISQDWSGSITDNCGLLLDQGDFNEGAWSCEGNNLKFHGHNAVVTYTISYEAYIDENYNLHWGPFVFML